VSIYILGSWEETGKREGYQQGLSKKRELIMKDGASNLVSLMI
jgi:hypothetical protein